MKKIMLFLIGTVCCLWLTGCAGPGPYGAYTGIDCYPGPVHTVRAAVATGASLLENVFHHGRYYHHGVDAPYGHRTPVIYPLPPRPYIYR